MKWNRNAMFLIFVLIAFIMIYHNVYTPWLISGKYVYCCKTTKTGMLKMGDLLKLNNNETFTSTSLGNGSFRVSLSRLELKIKKKHFTSSSYAELYRPWLFGNPRIKVAHNSGYFEKIE